MQEPKKPASPTAAAPLKKTDAEFFGVPDRKVSVAPREETARPDWYQEYLSGDAMSQDFPVYAESWPAVEIFLFCQFQWRQGFSGIEGLDYAAVMPVIALRYPRKSKQLEVLDDINALEFGVMTAIYELRKAAEDKAEAERARNK